MGRKRCTANRCELHKEWTEAWWSRHQEHHTQTCRGIWQQLSSEDVLPGLRRRRTGLLPGGPKSSFHMRASFVFHLETNVLEVWRKGGEAHSSSFLKSSVKFPQSVMIWVQCHLLCVGPLCFLKPTSLHPFTKSFWSTSCFLLPNQLFKDADFIFQQDLAPAHTAKITKSWLNDHGVGVLDWPPNSPDLNPIEDIWGIVKRK